MELTRRIATLQRIRKLSRLMDSAFRIPGTKFRIGLDPIMGLVPGLGDLVGAAFSGYIIILAVQLGVPSNALGKMIFNAGIEAVIGGVPLIGDLFDAYFKANLRNVAMLEEYLTQADPELEEAAPPAEDIAAFSKV
jgi:hypothetical protein